ncbi:hypothetical protein [Methylobacterium frigidaeris]|uniref:Uncharacterized protein n=1 Tax=Methylobacterium frigidaeris TaxID=2038277 RepID=A0AA37HK23_9HYPH|nr:hypothetical protein [Methylobacterium frigidaeris]GJD67069.1 hypothetical protein MPEAHAMD_7276 [Methylobacterium frigidaeris]
MPDFFENPTIRRRLGTPGLDWNAFLTERDEDEEPEEIATDAETDVEDDA